MLESGHITPAAHEQPTGSDAGLVAIPTLFKADKSDTFGIYSADSPQAQVTRANQGAITHIKVDVTDGQGNTATLSGGGVIVDANGLTGTDNHVVNPPTFTTKDGQTHQVKYERIQVTTNDGHVHNATVVDFNAATDKALIQLAPDSPGQQFQFAKLGSSNIKPLQQVLALGFPLTSNDMHLSVGHARMFGSQTYMGAIDPGASPSLFGVKALDIDMHTERGESGTGVFDSEGNVIGQVEAVIQNPFTNVPETTVVSPVEDLIALVQHSRSTLGARTPMVAQTGPQIGSPVLLPSAATTFDARTSVSWADEPGGSPYLRFGALFDSLRT